MNFEESVIYAADLMKQKNIVLGLDSMRELLKRLGNPQDQLKFIHMAGTNGKGSILAFVSSVLAKAGYRVGRYTSPSVFTYCEKFAINGQPIPEETVARLMTRVRDVSDAMAEEGLPHPTSFETETAVSFLYFAEEGCDLVGLECGMGGETDATNVVKTTILSIIASISLDHMQFLGDTRAKIAKVKSGIIKEGTACVCYGQIAEVTDVIKEKCEAVHASLVISAPEDACVKKTDFNGSVFDYHGLENVQIPLVGSYQIKNAATALEVVWELQRLGYQIKTDDIYEGMASVIWPGRFQKVLDAPIMFIDGAHNPDAALNLRDSVNLYFTNRKILYIMGILADKDYRQVVDIMTPMADEIYTVTPDSPRALSAEKLAACIDEERTNTNFAGEITVKHGLSEAIQDALKTAGPEDVVLAFGSLSFLGDYTKALKEIING